MQRIIVYIDGFNLYFGLKNKGWRKYYWLDVESLCRKLLLKNQKLTCTKYFTARISYPPDKEKRQNTFLEALDTLSGLEILYGRYQQKDRECPYCKKADKVPSEKMTDVNIAVEMLSDAFNDNFDVALLLSADGDLVPAVRAVKALVPAKKVIVAFPPMRYSPDLLELCDGRVYITRRKLRESQLPDQVTKADGFVLRRPASWK